MFGVARRLRFRTNLKLGRQPLTCCAVVLQREGYMRFSRKKPSGEVGPFGTARAGGAAGIVFFAEILASDTKPNLEAAAVR